MYFMVFVSCVCLCLGNGANIDKLETNKSEFDKLKDQVEILIKRDAEREKEIATLRTESELQKTEIVRLNARVQATRDLVEALGYSTYGGTIPAGHLGNVGGIIENKERSRRQRVSKAVAFFAEIQAHDYVNLGTNQNIRFTDAQLNTGDYSPTQGVFTAPLSGLYLLSTTISGYVSHSNLGHSEFMIDVNGTPIAKLTMAPREQASQTIIYRLKARDQVSIRNAIPTDGLLGGAYSTFSGFLLYEEDGSGDPVGK